MIGRKERQFLLLPPPFSSSLPHTLPFPLRVFCALCMFDHPHGFERTTADSTCAPCPTPASWLKTCRTAPVWDCLCNSRPSDMTYTLGWRAEVDNIWHDRGDATRELSQCCVVWIQRLGRGGQCESHPWDVRTSLC